MRFPRSWHRALRGLMTVLAINLGVAQVAEASPAGIPTPPAGVPLYFEANDGQAAADVKFLARGQAYTAFFTPNEVALVLRGRRGNAPIELRMKFLGANVSPAVAGLEAFRGTVNYLVGNDPVRWKRRIPAYRRVAYRDVYPGIDIVYYGNRRHLEYDVIVAPMADPGWVQFQVEGAERLYTDDTGDLLLTTAAGELRLRKPTVYQMIDGHARVISSRYVTEVMGTNSIRVGVRVADYDVREPLIIDPMLVYSSYLGGRDPDEGRGIAVDAGGNVYVTGVTESRDFPLRDPAREFGGGYSDVFVTKLTPDGADFAYSTFLGGAGEESGNAIAVDDEGNAYVTGVTDSRDFPLMNAWQGELRGATAAFVAVLTADGSDLIYSTYLGGGGGDWASGIAVDVGHNAYVTGTTDSEDFPTTDGAFQPRFGGGPSDAFVVALDPIGAPLYSSYLGGDGLDRGHAIAVDGDGNAYVTGVTRSSDFPLADPWQDHGAGADDAFVTKVAPDGSGLVYSTYLGGSADDNGNGIAVDADGHAYVVGATASFDFPTVAPFQASHGPCALRQCFSAFVAKFQPDGSAPVYATYLGGSRAKDIAIGVAVNQAGEAYVTGSTETEDFPTERGLQSYGLNGDGFVTKLAADGSDLIYSTYLGGSGNDGGRSIAVDDEGNAYVTGSTSSIDFPTADPFQDQPGGAGDAFVTKIADDF